MQSILINNWKISIEKRLSILKFCKKIEICKTIVLKSYLSALINLMTGDRIEFDLSSDQLSLISDQADLY